MKTQVLQLQHQRTDFGAADLLDECWLLPERTLLTPFFRFRPDVIHTEQQHNLRHLAMKIGDHFPVLMREVGEPRALQVYSCISGVLQTLPDDVGVSFKPERIFITALLYIGWELAGSWQYRRPSSINSASDKDVMPCVYRILNYMTNRQRCSLTC